MVCAFIEFESWSSADRAWKKYMSTSWRTLLETGRTQIPFYDVRSEKFCLINNDIDIPAGLADHTNSLTLLNYEGKPGIIQLREREEVVSWVLVDAASHKWSKHIYVLNPLGESIVTGNKFVGMTSTCFGLNQNHLWSLNLPIVINLSHHSSSKASCLSTFRRRPSVQRVHLAQSCDVVLKLPLFVHPSQVSRVFISSDFVTGAIRFQVSSWSLDVGARAVHARSTSFQTLPFGLINVGSDYFMLMVVTYSGIHLMLPTVLQWTSKTLSFSFVITCFMFCFMMFIKPSRIPSGSYLVTDEHSSGCNSLNSF
ncbi:hypothetical protein F2Q69_00041101 [Brassica cretica]|uniref:F-box associated beta-propeller type 3 domain-containing protein n=1 Tax=Brassica cretica TaxID=69181 RepID=A0A8S9NS54_BRACR|nr:hypothetical protein F2Q69_00041101 [Brassica cretica]